MKTLICAIGVLISIPLQAILGAEPEEEVIFLTAAKQAFDNQDTNALFALICWDRVPDKFIKSARNASMREINNKVSDMFLVNSDPNAHRVKLKDVDGVEYLPNLPVIKNLKIVFEINGSFQTVNHPVGEKDGKLYLLENAPVESDNTNSVGAARLEKVLSFEK
jgi:hypothetical protein